MHLVAHELTDLSAGLASVGNRKTPFPLPHSRGTRLITADRALIRAACRRGATSSMQYDHIDHIKVKTRNFRQRLRRPLQQHVVHTFVGPC